MISKTEFILQHLHSAKPITFPFYYCLDENPNNMTVLAFLTSLSMLLCKKNIKSCIQVNDNLRMNTPIEQIVL